MIAVEGIEGAGKSTAMSTIQQYLKEQAIPFICTREPGGTAMGEELRALLKANTVETVLPVTELLLMYASRAQLLANVIQPALAAGKTVISDRFELSTLAYQGAGRRLPKDAIETLSKLCLHGFKPDLTLYLDVDYATSQARLNKRGAKDRFEHEHADFFNRVRDCYLFHAQHDCSVVTIDASQPLGQVTKDIQRALSQLWS